MTMDLANRGAQLPAAAEWRTMMEMADVFIKSGFMPEAVKTPAAAVTIIAKGRELGLPPLYAISNISIIKGKPVCGAEAMLALIYRDHGDTAVTVLETTDKVCRVSYKRRGGERGEFAWTIADAERAGLAKSQTWTQYTSAMLRARCISAMARMAFPDSIAGMYTPEELGARVVVDADGQVVMDDYGAFEETKPASIEAPVINPLHQEHLEMIKTAKSLAELENAWKTARVDRGLMDPAHWAEINKLTNDRKAEFEAALPEPVPA